MRDAATIQRDALDSVIEFDGRVFLSSHFFFEDENETPVAEVIDGKLAFLSADALGKRDVRLAALPAPAQGAEKVLEDKIFRDLAALRRPARRQVKTPFGVIDLLIEEEVPTIIECKASGDTFSVAEALGQLLRYWLAYPAARLFVATPQGISNDGLKMMKRCGVALWK